MKLTPKQFCMLERVCKTNGGGVHAGFSEGNQDTKTIRQLERKGLVQGKAGRSAYAVHTKEGFAAYRSAIQPMPTEEK